MTQKHHEPLELHTPFNRSSNQILYSMDVQYMLGHTPMPIRQTMLGLLQNSNFEDCLLDRPDYERSRELLKTLKSLPCDDYAKATFVKALASHHGVVDHCQQNFPDPDHPNLFLNDSEWERNYNIVCIAIGTLTLQQKMVVNASASNRPQHIH